MQQMSHKYFQGVLLLITSYSSEFPAWCSFRGLTILPLNTKWKLILRLIQSHGVAFLCGFVTVLLMLKENWFWGQNVFPVLWLIIWQSNTMVSPTSALYPSNVCELFPPSQAESCGKHIKQDYIYRARVYLPPTPTPTLETYLIWLFPWQLESHKECGVGCNYRAGLLIWGSNQKNEYVQAVIKALWQLTHGLGHHLGATRGIKTHCCSWICDLLKWALSIFFLKKKKKEKEKKERNRPMDITYFYSFIWKDKIHFDK